MDYPADSQVPRVLLVDYDGQVRDDIQEVLSVNGISVTIARDPYQAIEIMQMQDRAFDLIIAEWYLPIINGSIFAEIVQGSNDVEALYHSSLFKKDVIYYSRFVERHGYTPFLFSSSKPLPEDVDLNGANYFSKNPCATRRPFFDEKGLYDLVRDLISREQD